MTCLVCLPKPDSAFLSGCSCDYEPYPPCDAIPPGSPQLPAQVLGFPQFRENLLSTAARRPEFLDWAARAVDDLGVVLLESWAYVLDILAFYDRRIAEECYIRTARDPASLRRLVGLLGYQPSPAVASSAIVAAIADGRDPVTIPAGTQLRSKSVPGIPAQLFETKQKTLIDPRKNGWQLAPVRPTIYSGILAFAPGETGVLAGQVVAIVVGGAPSGAATVVDLSAKAMPDGAEYRVATLSPEPSFATTPQLSSVDLFAMSQSAAPSPFSVKSIGAVQSGSSTSWVLDSLYPQIVANDLVVIETATGLIAARVHAATTDDVQLGTTGSTPTPYYGTATKLVFASSYAAKRIHFRAVPAGRLINPALAEVTAADLLKKLAAGGTHLPVPETSKPVAFAVAGAAKSGALVTGSIDIDAHGNAALTAQALLDKAADKLAVPIRYHGNLIEVTRGETVLNEILGSGNSSRPFQTFRLKKKPLTYLPDESRPGGIAPQLQVRVNGILWRRVDSFLSSRRGQRVYIVRHDEKGETDIIFGDRVRPQTGINNVTASYRYGAGKAAPPAGELTQIVGKVPGLGRLIAPLAGGGGADAENPAKIKINAPRSVLTYGRAVSLADYAAIVAGFPGVIASDVQWAWAPGTQTAGVQAWIVADGGTVALGLQATLAKAGDPLIPIYVSAATADKHSLSVIVAVSPDYAPADVRAAVLQALTDPETGLLAPPNIMIGSALFRSRIARRAADVEGVVGIVDILVDGVEMPNAISAPQGHYLSFDTTVGGVA
jgi:hypothetical protein